MEKDKKQAVYWWRKAAERGDSEAQSSLGIAYYEGEGIAKDIKQAFYWAKKSAEQGDPFGQMLLDVIEQNGDSSSSEQVYDVVEQMPSFPGGQSALFQFLSQNIHYPEVCEENGIQGRVICDFIVEADGSISDVQVKKMVDPSLDREAVRVIKSMPKWNPGKDKGKPVRVRYTVPVTFRLQ